MPQLTPPSSPLPLRIGILGGSFDPVHSGHMDLARAACRGLALDRLYLVPAAIPPHKRGRRRAPGRHRLAMARLAARLLRAEGIPARVDNGEILRPRRVSYTIDTVERLRRRSGPGAKLWLVLGSDSLAIFHTWHRLPDLLARVTIAVGERPGFPARREIARAVRQIAPRRGRFALLPMRRNPASATALRKGASGWERLPGPIARYARRHRLYPRAGSAGPAGAPRASRRGR